MGDMIDRDAALTTIQQQLALWESGTLVCGLDDLLRLYLPQAIAALPAVTVGVPADVRDYAIDVSEAYDTIMEVERNPTGAWQVIQALAGHLAALETVTQPALEPAPSDAGAATYGLPTPQSGEVPASSAPTPATPPAPDARLRGAVAQLDAGATLSDFTKTLTDAAAVATKAREAALREVLALKRHGSTVPYDPTEFIDVDDVLALLTEKPHDRA